MISSPIAPSSLPMQGAPPADRQAVLREKAEALEAAFLAEMLGHAGLDANESGFSGGIGETQFASFLREEQAKAMVAAGGIGLAESLFRAMTRAEAGTTTGESDVR